MAQTLKFGNKTWATKVGSTLAYNDENGNYKPLPFNFTRSTSATRVNKEGLIEVVTNERPRIDYTDTSDGVLLLEKEGTNLINYSEAISNSSPKNGTFLDNFAISPDGTQNATKLIATDGDPYFYQSIAVASGDYTISVYVKGIGSTIGKEFLLLLGGGVNSTPQTITGEWKRFTFSRTISSGNAIRGVEIPNPGVAGDELLVWGFQVERNSVASSYIPTQGSASTRVAETASGAGNSEVFNDSEGVLFVDIDALANDGTYRSFSLSDGSTDNELLVYYYGNNILAADFRVGAVNQAPLTANINQLINNKISFSYKVNNFKLYVNGFLIATDTSGSVPTINTFNNLSISRANGSLPFYGKTKEIGYYDAILTDLELEYLTSYRSWTSMVNELNLNIIYNG